MPRDTIRCFSVQYHAHKRMIDPCVQSLPFLRRILRVAIYACTHRNNLPSQNFPGECFPGLRAFPGLEKWSGKVLAMSSELLSEHDLSCLALLESSMHSSDVTYGRGQLKMSATDHNRSLWGGGPRKEGVSSSAVERTWIMAHDVEGGPARYLE